MLDNMGRSVQRQASRLGNGALDKLVFSESFILVNTLNVSS